MAGREQEVHALMDTAGMLIDMAAERMTPLELRDGAATLRKLARKLELEISVRTGFGERAVAPDLRGDEAMLEDEMDERPFQRIAGLIDEEFLLDDKDWHCSCPAIERAIELAVETTTEEFTDEYALGDSDRNRIAARMEALEGEKDKK